MKDSSIDNISDNELYCNGERYNFKKGMEKCPIRDNCKRWHRNKDKWYELKSILFEKVKDFRRCKYFIPN